MRDGSGSLSFRSDLPVSISEEIRDLVDERNGGTGAHVVITTKPIDPVNTGDSGGLALARYTGRIVRRPSRTSLEFVGIASWLDTYLDAAVTRTSGTPSQWLGDLLTNDLSAGTVDATGTSNVTRSFPAHITTARQALDVVAGLGGWEWRAEPDFTIDAAVKGTLFRSPPEVVVTRKNEGPDATYRGIEGGMLDQSIDVSATATKAVALAQGIGDAIAKGTATDSVNLLAPKGTAAAFVTVFSAPSEEDANANTAAQNFLNLQGPRYEISVNSRTHTIPQYVMPGDEVYLFDQAAGIVDTANQIQFRGRTIFPALVRCTELSWPIEQGYGVYIRPNGSAPTWIDVTPWVQWETGDAWWTVGDWSPANYGRANRTAPEIEDRIAGTDGGWANISLSSGNWTLDQQPQWRYNAGRVELRGWATRTSSTFTAGATLFATGGSNPPVPAQTYRVIGGVVIAAATPDAQAQRWIIDAAFASSSAGWAIAVGDSVSFDGIWWPIT